MVSNMNAEQRDNWIKDYSNPSKTYERLINPTMRSADISGWMEDTFGIREDTERCNFNTEQLGYEVTYEADFLDRLFD